MDIELLAPGLRPGLHHRGRGRPHHAARHPADAGVRLGHRASPRGSASRRPTPRTAPSPHSASAPSRTCSCPCPDHWASSVAPCCSSSALRTVRGAHVPPDATPTTTRGLTSAYGSILGLTLTNPADHPALRGARGERRGARQPRSGAASLWVGLAMGSVAWWLVLVPAGGRRCGHACLPGLLRVITIVSGVDHRGVRRADAGQRDPR